MTAVSKLVNNILAHKNKVQDLHKTFSNVSTKHIFCFNTRSYGMKISTRVLTFEQCFKLSHQNNLMTILCLQELHIQTAEPSVLKT